MKFKNSLFARNVSLLKIAGKIIISEVKERVIDLDVYEQVQAKVHLAKKISGDLASLKGAAMKLGQMLSLDTSDFLPPEAVEIFSKLQKDAEPIDFEIIETQIKSEIGEKYHQLEIERLPLAVASIGQVHKARIKNESIVLKIQFPGIEKTIESDVKILKIILGQTSILLGKSLDLNAFFEELRSTLLQETDYQQEGENMEKVRFFFISDNRYIFPKWIKEFSSKKVLAMEFMEGIGISDWIRSHPTTEQKNKVGLALYDLFTEEFFNLGMVQTDPNPGNFLINKHDQIVVLDFGATKEYGHQFKEGYKEILCAAYAKDRKALIERSIKFNLISQKEESNVLDYYCDMMEHMISPFHLDQEFDFTDENYYNESRDYALNISKICKHSPPPENILFLHRKLGGIFQILKKMEMKINLHHSWKKYLDPP